MKTAVDYLQDEILQDRMIKAKSIKEWNDVISKAREMEKDQICWAYFDGQYKDKNDIPSKYYYETYGSKENDENIVDTNEMIFDQELFNYFSQEFNINLLGTEMQDIIYIVKRYTSSQTEISDEEIEKCVGNGMHDFYKGGFIEGAKWYREQLKKKI